MATIPKKVAERLKTEGNRYQKLLKTALDRDVNESDTVTIVTDILSDVFGWDKYSDLTSEYQIRGTYCDIAVKQNDRIWLLVEVKAVGLGLKDNHLKQAVNYSANAGIDWVALTNGVHWRIYKIIFGKPVDYELVTELDFLDLNFRSRHDLQTLFVLCKRGAKKSLIGELYEEAQLTNKYVLSALIQSESVLALIKKQIRKINSNVKVDTEDLKKILVSDVLKREVTEDDKISDAIKLVRKAERAPVRRKKRTKADKATPVELD